MNFNQCSVAGKHVYGEEARINFEAYVDEGIQYAAVDNNADGTFGGMIHLYGVAAVFYVTFDSLDEGVSYLSRAGAAA